MDVIVNVMCLRTAEVCMCVLCMCLYVSRQTDHPLLVDDEGGEMWYVLAAA